MASPDPTQQLVTGSEARAVQPAVPELNNLVIKEVENSHTQAMHRQKRGLVGVVCGTGREKSGNIALLVIAACFVLIGVALYSVGLTDPFFKLLNSLLGIIGLALGYLFGVHSKQ